MIQQDENVKLVMQMILSRNRPFAPEVRSEVLRRLEEGIGRKLVFAPEHVRFFCLFHQKIEFMRRANLRMQRNSDTASMRALHVKQTKKFTKGVES